MAGGKAKAGSESLLCCLCGCLCWSPSLQSEPDRPSDSRRTCPRAAADSRPSCGSEIHIHAHTSRFQHFTFMHLTHTFIPSDVKLLIGWFSADFQSKGCAGVRSAITLTAVSTRLPPRKINFRSERLVFWRTDKRLFCSHPIHTFPISKRKATSLKFVHDDCV